MAHSPPFELFARVLLATEATEFDAGAERLALALAARTGAPLTAVLPVAGNAEFEAVAPALAARSDARANAALRQLQAQAAAAGATLETRVRHGSELHREITEEAAAGGATLLVARRRGQRGFLARLLVGEMVSQVVAQAPCPVLLVPRAGGLWQRRVLAAIDPREPRPAREALLANAIAAAALGGAALSVLAAADPDSPAARAAAQAALDEAQAQARAAGAGDIDTTLATGGRAAELIVQAAADRHADLVVLGRRNPASGRHARLGSTAQKVVGAFAGPVLVHIDPAPRAPTP